MHLRLIAFAALCAGHASAASLQPVEAGLQPLYDRIATIQAEKQTLKLKLQGSDVDTRERDAAYLRFKKMDTETYQLEEAIEKAKSFAQTPLVIFMAPALAQQD